MNDMDMNDAPNFQEAMQADQAIYQLAAYDVAKGLIMIPESAEQVVSMQRGIAKRFNYFKRLIQNSEVTFSDIHRTVVEKHGPFPNTNRNMSVDEFIKDLEEPETPVIRTPAEINGVLNKLLGEIIQLTGQEPIIVNSDMGNVEVIPVPLEGLQNMMGMGEIEKIEEIEQIEEMEEPNPFLFQNIDDTDTQQIDRIPPNKRVLPKSKSPKKDDANSKGKSTKNGRKRKTTKSTKPKPRKSRKDKTDT